MRVRACTLRCKCVCVHVRCNAYVHFVCACMHVRMCVLHMCVCAGMHVRMCIVCMYICSYGCNYVCMYVCMSLYGMPHISILYSINPDWGFSIVHRFGSKYSNISNVCCNVMDEP